MKHNLDAKMKEFNTDTFNYRDMNEWTDNKEFEAACMHDITNAFKRQLLCSEPLFLFICAGGISHSYKNELAQTIACYRQATLTQQLHRAVPITSHFFQGLEEFESFFAKYTDKHNEPPIILLYDVCKIFGLGSMEFKRLLHNIARTLRARKIDMYLTSADFEENENISFGYRLLMYGYDWTIGETYRFRFLVYTSHGRWLGYVILPDIVPADVRAAYKAKQKQVIDNLLTRGVEK